MAINMILIRRQHRICNNRLMVNAIAISFTIVETAWAQKYNITSLNPALLPTGDSSNAFVQNVSSAGAVGEDLSSQDPILWSITGGAGVDLSPPGYSSSWLNFATGSYQAGAGIIASTQERAALLWKGTASSAMTMNAPPGVSDPAIFGADSTQEVGMGWANVGVGLLWTGTAGNAVVLAGPAGFYEAGANGVGGNEQVGDGWIEIGGQHALLWHGSSASVVDLAPAGFDGSVAYGTDGTQQVGSGWIQATAVNHALLWYGTAASAVDLNPAGFVQSEALATNGSEQVGDGEYDDETKHALLWSGSADSAVNLQDLLPSNGTWNESVADSIDADGNVFGSAEGTYDGITGTFLIEWSPVPEPAGTSLMAISLTAMLHHPVRRKRVTKQHSHACAAPTAVAE